MNIQRIQFLEKYAARAENLLSEKFGKNYTSHDVEKLAEALIRLDVKRAANIDRVEELMKQARYTANAFVKEIDDELGEGSFQKMAKPALLNSLKSLMKNKVPYFSQKVLESLKSTGQKATKMVKANPLESAGVAGIGIGGTLGAHSILSND